MERNTRFRYSPQSATGALPYLALVALVVIATGTAWSQVSLSRSPSTSFKPHTPLAVQNGTAVLTGHYNPNQMLRLTLGLQPPHPVEEQAFLESLQTKGSHDFHQYLTAAEWTEQFDPSVEDEQAVVNWATAQGLTVTRRFPNRLLVDVEGTAGTIEKVFGVTLNSYQVGTRTAFSNDHDPQIPSSLANIIHSVGGLNNIEMLHPMNKNAKEPAFPDYSAGPAESMGESGKATGDISKLPKSIKASQKNGLTANYTSGPPYDPQDMYSPAAYDAYALYNLGHCCNPTNNSGGTPPQSSIAIATFGAQQSSDFYGWHDQYTYLAEHWFTINIDGTPSCCDGEGTMDFEWSTAMSNSFGSYLDTASVFMYDGVTPTFGETNDVYNAMLTDGYARNFSTSWGCEEIACYDEGDMDTADSIFSSMIGQGWSLTAAAGDQGATAGCGDAIAVQFPASDPNIVGAGGATLYLLGGPPPGFFSVTAWGGGPDGCFSNDGGGTGGYSAYWGEPSFQSGLPSRGVPDIALNADWYNTPQYFFFEGALSGNGGTSIVAPETVGFFAQENAYLLALGNICGAGSSACSPMGAVNPYLYEEGYDSVAPHYPFYDITTGNNCNDITALYGLGCYSAGPGWDPVTGWGMYNFLQLAWAINWMHIPGYTYPVVTFSGPAVNKWYNSDQEVTWSVSTPSENGLPSDGTAGFSQAWDSDPGNPYSEATPSTIGGYPVSPYNAFYNGPTYANAVDGCLDFTGTFCAGSIGGVQGWHTVNVRSWGNEGENGGDYTYGPIGYDTIAPTATDTLSGTLSGGNYISAVTNTITSSDPGYPTTGSGVANVVYQVNGGTITTYSGAFAVSTVGVNSVSFHATDNAGNVESTQTTSFTIVSGTSTSVVSSLDPAPLGKVVTFTATVSPSLVGSPTGSVTFKDGATVLATKTLSGGIAKYATSTLAKGSHSITATYNGATYFTGSTSVALTQVILNTTTTTLTSSPNPSTLGQSVTFTAKVAHTGSGTPTGTVTFKEGSVVLGSSALSGGTTATLSTSVIKVGTHAITAEYNGDSNFANSTSEKLDQVVEK
jgi:hypothetical protein